MADLKITQLPPLAGSAVASLDVIPLTDVSASLTKKINVKDLIEYGIDLIDPGSIPQDKVSLTGFEIPDGTITALKLADNSSGVVGVGLPAAGARVGQIGVDTDTSKLSVWNGSAWLEVKAAASVNTINGSTNGLVLIGVTQTGDTVDIEGALAPTAGARQFLAGPTANGGAVTQRTITGLDLPPATTGDRGAVSVGIGLKVSADGVLSIDNAVVAENRRSLATWNASGLVTGGSPIEGSDLPVASTTPGVVYPDPLGSLGVDGNGKLFISSGVAAGTYTKVGVNNEGLVVQGLQLEADDLPNIPADKIVGGELEADVIQDRSIEEIKLADYSTCYVQEGNPGGGSKLGQFWFTPSTNQLRVYARGSAEDIWLSVGFGALQSQNLRWAGTIDASTSTIVTLTAIGVSEGLVAGGSIPAPSDALSGAYFVTQVSGSSISQPNVQVDTFTEGDWLLCIDQAQGYIHIDANAGGGGGGTGGARYLDDLLDVEIGGVTTFFGAPRVSLQDEQLLMYDSISGMWVNSGVVNGGSY